jgi:hypothetical protein
MGMAFLITIHLLYMALVAQPYLKMLRATTRYGGGKFQFTSLDILAISFGLVPTAWLTSLSAELPHNALDVGGMLAAFVFFGSSQATGMVMFIATNAAPTRKSRSAYASAFGILVGAMFGLLMPIAGIILIVVNKSDEERRKALERKRARVPRPSFHKAEAKAKAPKSPISRTTAGPPSRPGSPS